MQALNHLPLHPACPSSKPDQFHTDFLQIEKCGYNNQMPEPVQLNPRMHQKAHVQRCDWPNCGGACCIYGAWVDRIHTDTILEHADLIAPWMNPEHRDLFAWFDGQEEDDPYALSGKVRHTRVAASTDHYGGMACVFLREDKQCALQAAAEAHGLHKWQFKPFYCILHPLEFDSKGRITIDDPELMVTEPASCLKESDQEILFAELFNEELEYLLNQQHEDPKEDSSN